MQVRRSVRQRTQPFSEGYSSVVERRSLISGSSSIKYELCPVLFEYPQRVRGEGSSSAAAGALARHDERRRGPAHRRKRGELSAARPGLAVPTCSLIDIDIGCPRD